MSSYSVHVANLSPSTTEQGLHDFFSFCGKITTIAKQDKDAKISFEKVSAAKTALMLNGGTLDGSNISVTSEDVHEDHPEPYEEHHDATPRQEDKPRAGIAAEYLAKGYILSDSILQRAIDIDAKQGISSRFLSYIQSLDHTLGNKLVGQDQTLSGKVSEQLGAATSVATKQVQDIDQKHGISTKAQDYYTKAVSSPFGQRVLQFYTTTTKQIVDIHEEARRIADQHKQPVADSVPAPTGETGAAPLVV